MPRTPKFCHDPDTIEYKIGEIFSELKNRLQSGYNLREVIEQGLVLLAEPRPQSGEDESPQ